MRISVLRNMLLAVGCFFFAATAADAQNCLSMLQGVLAKADRTDPSIFVTMVTLNDKHVASFTETRLYYRPASKGGRRGGTSFPARFVTLTANADGIDNPKFDFGFEAQVFSDRHPAISTLPQLGVPAVPRLQGFDRLQADDIDFEIPLTEPVVVTMTLRSWGNTKKAITPQCGPGGFLRASAPDAQYMLRVKAWPPNSPD